ncbi:nucleotide exchange factor GrpE [Croceimicrobium hydrocarbonivorans]|uniref:Protein GrpE n=1 Tax=Croceimicrobium hydrocarbonivorans TaxID=2761580 RepID=A0A7H0VC74_9FLAO|nr:nucleotide exchange factor GrpE [Croceimicrobium hydrocarbonivorans]QNR23322.1 nucleotide exchange factor GrpE [Croceimicrobium hydrocarbonivorans]
MSTKNTVQDPDKEALDPKENLAETQAENTDKESVETQEEMSPEEQLEARIAELEEELKAEKDQKLRLYADFENHRKRTAKERVELFGSANQELMSALLPIIDDFKRALSNLKNEEDQEGISLIFNKFENTLKQKGLKPMESTIGKEFNVDTMEAITRIPAPSEDMKGKVVDEIEQGFHLGTKIIRYARVVVGE